MERLLIRGGYVISMDSGLGDIPNGDLLIVDGRIAAVGAGLEYSDTPVLDAAGMIVMPGMVDTHRHTWQTQLRAICADMSLMQYMRCIRFTISPVYTPEDVYVGNYVGALEALNAGVTTLYDYSHTVHSPEHADEAIRGLQDAQIRGIYAYGYYPAPVDEPVFDSVDARIADAKRVRQRYFSSSDARLHMAVAVTEVGMYPLSVTRKEILSGRDMDVPQTIHTNCFWGSSFCMGLTELAAQGLLGPDQVHVHCNSVTAAELRLLADNGAKISCTPDTEMQMGMGHPMINRATAVGIKPTLGADVISCNGGDLLTQARLGLQDARVTLNDAVNQRKQMPEDIPVKIRHALEWLTVNGAAAMGMEAEIGSLSVGKQADVVLIAPNDFNLAPLNDRPGAVILQANVANVDTVILGGKVVKRHGKLLIDLSSPLRMAEQSRDRIMAGAARRGPLLPPGNQTAMAAMEQTAARNLML